MCNKINKTIWIAACFSIISCFLPALSSARLVVQTEVVSGNIAQKYDDQSVKLDNGTVYHPSRQGLIVDVPVGEAVTLRIVEEADMKVFFEYALGVNSLNDISPASIRKDNSPK